MYKFVELLADVVEANILIVFVGIFTVRGRIEKRWRQMVFFAVVTGVLCFFFDQIALVSWWKSIVVLLICFFVCNIMYKDNREKIIFSVAAYMAFATVFEFIVIYLLHCITKIDVSQFMTLGIERTTASIIVKILEISIICIIYRITLNKNMDAISKGMAGVVMSTCIVVTFMTVFFAVHYITGKYVQVTVLFYLVISMGMVLFVMYVMFVAAADADQQQELELIQLQNAMLKKSLEETKHSYAYWERIIHDYKNIILCLNSMVESQDYMSVCEYLKKEINQMQKGHHVVHSGNTLVDSVLNAKWLVADSNNIFFSIQGQVSSELPIPEIPFGRLLGNLIDNAIEGAQSYDNSPYVEVVLCQTELMLSLEISNSVVEKQIDFFNSSKKRKELHGIGLNSVREIVREYDGFFEIKQVTNRVVAAVEFFIPESF
jgi:sensor histidine kinase YesM